MHCLCPSSGRAPRTHTCPLLPISLCTRLSPPLPLHHAKDRRGYFARTLCAPLSSRPPRPVFLTRPSASQALLCSAHRAADAKTRPRRLPAVSALPLRCGLVPAKPSHHRRMALPDSCVCVAYRLRMESKSFHPSQGVACTRRSSDVPEHGRKTANKKKRKNRVAEDRCGDDGSNTRVILACARRRTEQVTARCFLDNVTRKPVLCTH